MKIGLKSWIYGLLTMIFHDLETSINQPVLLSIINQY